MRMRDLFRRKAAAPIEQKAEPVRIQFFSADGMRSAVRLFGGVLSDVDEVTRFTAFGAAVYAYAAMIWRADKYSEPELYVAQIDEEENEEWIQNHPLASILDYPSPDFDMGELLFITRLYRDMTGSAIWVKDANVIGTAGRLTPFSGDEFTVEKADGRIFGKFIVSTANGKQELAPERVVFWREIGMDPWGQGQAPVDVALQNLNLGQHATATVKQILRNALFPSVIIQADKEWNPDEQTYERWKADLASYGETRNKGKPLALLGGGNATSVGMTLKDLLPDAILDRVEANVAAAFRVPAVVLQFLVGLKNSPWSQMAEARRMAYEDTLQPMWKRDQKKLTHQLLYAPVDAGRQPVDSDLTHVIRFDTSDIVALQSDRLKDAQISKLISDIAKRNERRMIIGMDPLPDNDPRGDEIVVAPSPAGGTPPDDAAGRTPPAKGLPEAFKGTGSNDLDWLLFDIESKAAELTWRRDMLDWLLSQGKDVSDLAFRTLRVGSNGKVTSESADAFVGKA